ncbi:[FeFe] hydrogenase, group A [Mycoplasmatota bacterium zrk1]
MSDFVKMTINDIELKARKGQTVLEVAEENGIYIPRLCYLKGINNEGDCRVCVVDVDGQNGLKSSCKLEVYEGMKVNTGNEKVKSSVKNSLELLAANHSFECWACSREHNCEFLRLLRKNNVQNPLAEKQEHGRKERVIRDSSVSLVLDSGKCLLCGRCVSACHTYTGLDILSINKRGSDSIVESIDPISIDNSGCVYCGKCIQACPVGALTEKDGIMKVQEALNDPKKFVVIQPAPSVRVALAEEFGYPVGTNVEGKMYRAFDELGFDDIGDVNWSADLTIIEEGYEFIDRLQNGGVFPMFTSCSPGWIRYIEGYEAEYLPSLSSAKSPHMMQGAMTKQYYAPKMNIKPEDVFVVSVMPCIAKKFEIERPEMQSHGHRDVDAVITTRELARMIKYNEINFRDLEELKPKGQLSQFTGAANIFGATGGVMEAALRTVVEVLEGKSFDEVEYKMVRGTEEIKEATLNVHGVDVNVAVVHGVRAIKEFFEILKSGEKQYHFVEFMGCIGGCVNGGGQPITLPETYEKNDFIELRSKALYDEDKDMALRKSHKNRAVMVTYEEFLEKPNSHRAHEMLHTHYKNREYLKESK